MTQRSNGGEESDSGVRLESAARSGNINAASPASLRFMPNQLVICGNVSWRARILPILLIVSIALNIGLTAKWVSLSNASNACDSNVLGADGEAFFDTFHDPEQKLVPNATHCRHPRAPLHGGIDWDGSHNTSMRVGEGEASYHCEAGYELYPPRMRRKCMPGGVWSGYMPSCVPTSACLLPREGSQLVSTDLTVAKDTYYHHTIFIARYTCVEDSLLIGEREQMCIAGRWSHPAPRCLEIGHHSARLGLTTQGIDEVLAHASVRNELREGNYDPFIEAMDSLLRHDPASGNDAVKKLPEWARHWVGSWPERAGLIARFYRNGVTHWRDGLSDLCVDASPVHMPFDHMRLHALARRLEELGLYDPTGSTGEGKTALERALVAVGGGDQPEPEPEEPELIFD